MRSIDAGSRFNIHFTVAAAAATAARQACRIGDQQTVKLSTSWSIVVYDLPATASIKNCLELITHFSSRLPLWHGRPASCVGKFQRLKNFVVSFQPRREAKAAEKKRLQLDLVTTERGLIGRHTPCQSNATVGGLFHWPEVTEIAHGGLQQRANRGLRSKIFYTELFRFCSIWKLAECENSENRPPFEICSVK